MQSIHNTGEVDQFSVLVYLNSIVHSSKKTMDYKDANLPHMQVAGFHCLWLVLHWCIEKLLNMEYAKYMGYQVFTTGHCNVLSGDKYTVGCVNSGWVAASLRRYVTGNILLLGHSCEVFLKLCCYCGNRGNSLQVKEYQRCKVMPNSAWCFPHDATTPSGLGSSLRRLHDHTRTHHSR